MPTLEDILKVLEDGKWHDLKEIGKKTALRDLKVKDLAKFLAQYNFIKLDKDGEKAKLRSPVHDFLKRIIQIEGEEGAKRLEEL